jgi:hypothetical protein
MSFPELRFDRLLEAPHFREGGVSLSGSHQPVIALFHTFSLRPCERRALQSHEDC